LDNYWVAPEGDSASETTGGDIRGLGGVRPPRLDSGRVFGELRAKVVRRDLHPEIALPNRVKSLAGALDLAGNLDADWRDVGLDIGLIGRLKCRVGRPTPPHQHHGDDKDRAASVSARRRMTPAQWADRSGAGTVPEGGALN
jgi:hypothetical protein